MPSKGGRRSDGAPGTNASVVFGPPVPRPREEWDAAGFTAAEMARPLRRGLEVQRFNELATRENPLSPEEADDVYRFRLRRVMSRLRQLARAQTHADEGAVLAALDDLDGRLDELRRLEAERQLAGLAVGYEIPLEQRQAAIDLLLELARRRTPGLVAGADVPPAQPAGDLRVPAVAFTPTPQDAPVYILAPRSLPSDALERNVEAVAQQGANLRLVHDPADVVRDGPLPPLVINWGSSDSLPPDLVTLNRPEAVRIASDQVESIRRLGELAPRTVLRPDDMQLLRSDRVVAKTRHGARGAGKAVIAADAPWSERARHDLFQELVPRHREFRVSLLGNRVTSAYLKRPPEGTQADNLRPDWTHERVDVLPRAVVSAAREAARRIGLDYAGVDVIEDPNGRVYCLEANAAPGMSEHTLRSLYAQVQQTVRGHLREAS